MFDRSGEKSSVQVADLRRYGVLSSIKRWAWEEMEMWTVVVAARAVSCCPSSSSFALLCVPNDFLRFERLHPGTVLRISWTRLFEQCVGCHALRAGAFLYFSVVVGDICEFENVIQCPNAIPSRIR